jgi:hypothetical protein
VVLGGNDGKYTPTTVTSVGNKDEIGNLTNMVLEMMMLIKQG